MDREVFNDIKDEEGLVDKAYIEKVVRKMLEMRLSKMFLHEGNMSEEAKALLESQVEEMMGKIMKAFGDTNGDKIDFEQFTSFSQQFRQ